MDRLQCYSRRVKSINTLSDSSGFEEVNPSTYIRIAQLQSSPLFPSLRRLELYFTESFGSHVFLFLSPLLDSLEFRDDSGRGFEHTAAGSFLATLSRSPQMLRRIVLSGRMPVEIFKNYFIHFKQLRSLELLDAVFMTDFSLWEVLGTLPSLEILNMEFNDPESYPVHAPENSNYQSGGLRYFDALESLHVTGPSFLIQHLLVIIDSPCLKSISLSPCHPDYADLDLGNILAPSTTIMASKWSQSLKELTVNLYFTSGSIAYRNSKFLMPLTDLYDLHEIQTFILMGWRMEKNNDSLQRLVMSWPKLRTLKLLPSMFVANQAFLSLSNLRVIAENCPKLRTLVIGLDIDTIPPVDISSKSLRHRLEVLNVVGVHQSISQISQECQIQIVRHLDLNFPYLKTIEVRDGKWSGICDLVRLCQDARRGLQEETGSPSRNYSNSCKKKLIGI